VQVQRCETISIIARGAETQGKFLVDDPCCGTVLEYHHEFTSHADCAVVFPNRPSKMVILVFLSLSPPGFMS
jgi:hypothetical protein